jgi:hypothetical protein
MLLLVVHGDGATETIKLTNGAIVHCNGKHALICNPDGLYHAFTEQGTYEGWLKAFPSSVPASVAEKFATEHERHRTIQQKHGEQNG